LGVSVHNSVLDVESVDLAQCTSGRSIRGDELSDNGECLGSINRRSWAVEGSVTHAVRVEITPIGVAKRFVSGSNSAIRSAAASLLSDGTRMAL
jgi:hypothetical protein